MTTAEFLDYLQHHQATEILADDLASALVQRVVQMRDHPNAAESVRATTLHTRVAS